MRKGIRGCRVCRAPGAPMENLVPLVPLALWATLGPQAWRVLWDRRALRGLQGPLVPVGILALQAPQASRALLPSCMGFVGEGAQSLGPQRAAWRRFWPRSCL